MYRIKYKINDKDETREIQDSNELREMLRANAFDCDYITINGFTLVRGKQLKKDIEADKLDELLDETFYMDTIRSGDTDFDQTIFLVTNYGHKSIEINAMYKEGHRGFMIADMLELTSED